MGEKRALVEAISKSRKVNKNEFINWLRRKYGIRLSPGMRWSDIIEYVDSSPLIETRDIILFMKRRGVYTEEISEQITIKRNIKRLGGLEEKIVTKPGTPQTPDSSLGVGSWHPSRPIYNQHQHIYLDKTPRTTGPESVPGDDKQLILEIMRLLENTLPYEPLRRSWLRGYLARNNIRVGFEYDTYELLARSPREVLLGLVRFLKETTLGTRLRALSWIITNNVMNCSTALLDPSAIFATSYKTPGDSGAYYSLDVYVEFSRESKGLLLAGVKKNIILGVVRDSGKPPGVYDIAGFRGISMDIAARALRYNKNTSIVAIYFSTIGFTGDAIKYAKRWGLGDYGELWLVDFTQQSQRVIICGGET